MKTVWLCGHWSSLEFCITIDIWQSENAGPQACASGELPTNVKNTAGHPNSMPIWVIPTKHLSSIQTMLTTHLPILKVFSNVFQNVLPVFLYGCRCTAIWPDKATPRSHASGENTKIYLDVIDNGSDSGSRAYLSCLW